MPDYVWEWNLRPLQSLLALARPTAQSYDMFKVVHQFTVKGEIKTKACLFLCLGLEVNDCEDSYASILTRII